MKTGRPVTIETLWTSWLFLLVLVAKIVASFFFASDYLIKLFIPFLNHFVISGISSNPWEFFYHQGLIRMFPYPAVMLFLMTLPRVLCAPFLSVDWQAVTPIHLFAARIPLLSFDIMLFFVLLKFHPTHRKALTILYWCSPIIFFINYIHGQLDIIPTAIFFAALYLLINEKYLYSMVLLALAAASKIHIFIALPFVFVFLYRKKISKAKLALCAAVFLGLFMLVNAPYLGSAAFREMVFQSPEGNRFFEFKLAIGSTLSLVICPAVIFLLFIKFCSYKKLNREILMMFLGVLFASLVVFAPPTPGWFMWSLPFLIYFYVGNKEYSAAPFFIFNAAHLFYFIFFFEIKYSVFDKYLPSIPLEDIAVSLMVSSVAFILLWMLRLGMRKNEELRMASTPFLIGIGGDSGSGKHHLFKVLRIIYGRDNCMPIFGDDFHKWERGDEHWKVYSHLNPSGNRLHEGMDAAIALKDGRSIELVSYDHATGHFGRPTTVQPSKFIFFIGLHPFYLKKMRDVIPLKIFLDTDESLRKRWKLRRDEVLRGYEKSKIEAQICEREADRQKYIQPQIDFADLVIRYMPEEVLGAEDGSIYKIRKVRYTYDNSVHMDPLVDLLSKIPTLKIDVQTGMNTQEMEVSGSISARELIAVAHGLGLNLDELLVKTRRWLKNIDGVTQLIFLILYNYKREAR